MIATAKSEAWATTITDETENPKIFVAIALRRTALLIVSAALLLTNTLLAQNELWSRGLPGSPQSGPFRPFNVIIIESVGGNHLIATCSYANYTDGTERPPPVTVKGVMTKDGTVCPRVTAKVTNDVDGEWKTIGELGTVGKPVSRIVAANNIDDTFAVPLDIFRPLVGRFLYGALVLKTGQAAIFELKDLLSPEKDAEPKSDSINRSPPDSNIDAAFARSARFEDSKEYRRLLESKLFLTRADCARMSVMPSAKPEFALSVYSRSRQRSPRRRLYYVTVTEASKSIYQSLRDKDSTGVNVDRRTARLPARTAVALRELWKKMLSQANPNDALPDFSINEDSIEFSLDTSPNPISVDELPSAAKEEAITLERLRNLLVDYCEADWHERLALAKQIRKNAKNLSNRL